MFPIIVDISKSLEKKKEEEEEEGEKPEVHACILYILPSLSQ